MSSFHSFLYMYLVTQNTFGSLSKVYFSSSIQIKPVSMCIFLLVFSCKKWWCWGQNFTFQDRFRMIHSLQRTLQIINKYRQLRYVEHNHLLNWATHILPRSPIQQWICIIFKVFLPLHTGSKGFLHIRNVFEENYNGMVFLWKKRKETRTRINE